MSDRGDEPEVRTGVQNMSVRIPRQAIPWRSNAIDTLWTDSVTSLVLNGSLRVSLLHRPFSTRSAPGPNPLPTGWWTIGLGLRETKPHVLSGQCSGFTNIVSVCCQPLLRAMQQSRTASAMRDHIMDGCLARISLSQL